MGSPISLSGFNNIDFNLILNAIMEQERVPLAALENDRDNLQGKDQEYGVLATKLAALELAVEDLSKTDAFSARTLTNSDEGALVASAGTTTPIGSYDVIVQDLARAQTMASTSTYSDSNATVVASGGTLTIGGVTVTVSGAVTLEGLADAINGTTDVPVTASVVQSGPSQYQLVLTGNDTGAASGYTVTNALSGGAGLTFADLDGDGESGDDASDNAVSATDASASVNNIAITSETNTITGAIPGTTLTLLKADPAATVTLAVSRDDQAIETLIDGFVGAYNDLADYVDAQFAASAEGSETAIGRDGLLRGLRSSLRGTLSGEYTVGGTFTFLAEVGLGTNAAGDLTLDKTLFDNALSTARDDLERLFVGDGTTDGAFATLGSLVDTYTQAGGLLSGVQDRLDDQVESLDRQIIDMEERLAVRRASLEAEFIAADLAIAQLNGQLNSLSSLGNEYRLF